MSCMWENGIHVIVPLWAETTSEQWIPLIKGKHQCFPHRGPVMQTFDIFFEVSQDKLLHKQSRCWWFEMPCHSNCHIYPTIPLNLHTARILTSHTKGQPGPERPRSFHIYMFVTIKLILLIMFNLIYIQDQKWSIQVNMGRNWLYIFHKPYKSIVGL